VATHNISFKARGEEKGKKRKGLLRIVKNNISNGQNLS
jgi:hypothetical protein